MLENTSADVASMSPVCAAQGHRVVQLKRAYQRALKRKPTVIEQVAMTRAALLTARAEAAALDPNASHDDVVRLDNAAARSRAKLFDLIGVTRRASAGPSFLQAEARRLEREREAQHGRG